MRDRGIDHVSMVAGVAVIGLGLLLLGDQAGTLDLGWNLLGAGVALTVGAVLLATGIRDGRSE
jgi:hypothetical protein